ncbi:Testis-expressed sequence 9 protein [Plasmodiophora brassicae]
MMASTGEPGGIVDKRFLEQEEAMREMNERLEQRRKELAQRCDRIAALDPPGELDAADDHNEWEKSLEGDDDDIEDDDGAGERDAVFAVGADELSRLELEHQVLGMKGMSSDGREKLLSAKLDGAEKQVAAIKQACAGHLTELSGTRAELKAAQDQVKALTRQVKAAEARADKAEASASKQDGQVRQMTQELADAWHELQVAKKIVKDLEKGSKTRETRFNRAMAEAARYKSLAEEKQATALTMDAAMRDDRAAIEAENKKLKRAKAELMNIIKKQFKLIDVLKRQKMHIEAARMLSFTEEEFASHISQQTPK